MMERWFPLSYILNNLHRSLGMPRWLPVRSPLAKPVTASP